MKLLACLLVSITLVASCKESRTSRDELPSVTSLPAPVLRSSDEPVIRIFCEPGYGVVGLSSEDKADAPVEDSSMDPLDSDVFVWSDGRIAWRARRDVLLGHVAVDKIVALLQRLHEEGVFGDGNTTYSNSGIDSSFMVVDVRLPDRHLRLESCHEGFEHNPGLVGTDFGIVPLGDKTREEVLAATPASYRRFRAVWADIRATVASWIPATGEPYTGDFPVRR